MNRFLSVGLGNLLDIIEDLRLGALMSAVKDDGLLEGESSWQAYLQYRHETERVIDKEQNDLDENG
jgi:hypothetical protein